MLRGKLHTWSLIQYRLVTFFLSLIAQRWVVPQTECQLFFNLFWIFAPDNWRLWSDRSWPNLWISFAMVLDCHGTPFLVQFLFKIIYVYSAASPRTRYKPTKYLLSPHPHPLLSCCWPFCFVCMSVTASSRFCCSISDSLFCFVRCLGKAVLRDCCFLCVNWFIFLEVSYKLFCVDLKIYCVVAVWTEIYLQDVKFGPWFYSILFVKFYLPCLDFVLFGNVFGFVFNLTTSSFCTLI